MITKRQAFLGAIAVALVSFIVTAGSFLYYIHLATGDVVLTMKFLRSLNIVKSRYVKEVQSDKLISGAIGGMVRVLGDQHSMYLDGDVFKQFMMETEGQFGGIGVTVGMKDNELTVVAPVEGTPGEAAGIQSGDKIKKIDNESTEDMPIDIAVGKIRGPKDTFVELEIYTVTGELKTLKIMRTNIKLKTVMSKKLEDNIGYVRITMFNEHTFEDFAKEMEKLDKENVKGIVLDLRNNPGGLLEACVKVAEYFVQEGPIVSIVGRDFTEAHSSYNKKPKYKVVVLVNQGSASASEIVAGAIQDSGKGSIIGSNTYGKGSVQAILRLDNNSAIKLTCAKYMTPLGRVIDGIGIKPDLEITQEQSWANVLYKGSEKLRSLLQLESIGK